MNAKMDKLIRDNSKRVDGVLVFDPAVLRFGSSDRIHIHPYPIDEVIHETIQTEGNHLNMDYWHGNGDDNAACGTTHCRAGFATTLHPQGKELEARFGCEFAASLIYVACSVRVGLPDWVATESGALKDIEACATEARAQRLAKDLS
jgi:hypothetical protein